MFGTEEVLVVPKTVLGHLLHKDAQITMAAERGVLHGAVTLLEIEGHLQNPLSEALPPAQWNVRSGLTLCTTSQPE